MGISVRDQGSEDEVRTDPHGTYDRWCDLERETFVKSLLSVVRSFCEGLGDNLPLAKRNCDLQPHTFELSKDV